MKCPVCSQPAVDIGARDFDGRVFRCPQCKDYEITGSQMLKFLAASPSGRATALEAAKRLAVAGARPSINSRCQ